MDGHYVSVFNIYCMPIEKEGLEGVGLSSRISESTMCCHTFRTGCWVLLATN